MPLRIYKQSIGASHKLLQIIANTSVRPSVLCVATYIPRKPPAFLQIIVSISSSINNKYIICIILRSSAVIDFFHFFFIRSEIRVQFGRLSS